MKHTIRNLFATGALALASTPALADCGIEKGHVRVLSNDFSAMSAMADFLTNCASDTVTVDINQTAEHKDLQVAALTANPAQYSLVVVSNSSISPLLSAGLIRPLDELVEKHGAGLRPNQMIRVNGEIVAIAAMANAQHFYYRADILEDAGIAPPTTYEEVIAAGKALQAEGMETPFVANFKTGWNLGAEFVNLYMGYGGNLFEPGSAVPAVNSEAGLKTLATLAELTALAGPDFLTYDSNATTKRWEAGEVAMAEMWGSRAITILDDEGSTPQVIDNTVLAAAPTVGGGEKPSATLFWDGFVIPTNLSDAEAETAFKAMMNIMTPEFIAENNDVAVWLIDGYTPGATSKGVMATVSGGASSYPMPPFMGLMHTAIGAELSEFLQGKESAEQALSDIEAAYRAAAREQGFLD